MYTKDFLSLPFTKSTQDKIAWGNLIGASYALAVAQAAEQHPGLSLVVTTDTAAALKLEHEIGFFLEDKSISLLPFPDWETLPYDHFSPHQDIISQRLLTLYQLPRTHHGIVIVPISTLSARLCPRAYIESQSLVVKNGDQIDIHQMRRNLENAGYHAVNQVMAHGEFSMRGSLLDLYPMGCQTPYRLDFFDDELESIRLFDIETQRSGDTISSINLLPAGEFPTDEAAIERFRMQFREYLTVRNEKEALYHQVSSGTFPSGIESYLPLFFNETATLFDYLPDNTQLLTQDRIEPAYDAFMDEVSARYEDRRHDQLRPLLSPEHLYLRKEQLFSQFKPLARISLSATSIETGAGKSNAPFSLMPDVSIKHQSKQPHQDLIDFVANIKENQGRILFVAESEGRREALLDILNQVHLRPKPCLSFSTFLTGEHDLNIIVGGIEHSFIRGETSPLVILTETELLGGRVVQQRRRKKSKHDISPDAVFKNLTELSIGQPVVHFDHGVGRYQGLQTLDAGGITAEFVTIEYANEAKLYVPVNSLHLISRYSGADDEHAPLNRLGTEAWEKAKRKAAEKVRDVAAELLDVYARRAAKPGFEYKFSKEDYISFCQEFPFEETNDQVDAIQAVMEDMRGPTPMDRLVCGDVGFGKTEVAMRAAFIAASCGRQVAILVPTTLLAQQHFENFQDRFANWPIKIDVLSRFKSNKQQQQTLSELTEGKVDIVIGTHKLLQQDINFSDLGLLIVDEEHRFGVRQKDRIKSLRSEVDILTLTATPIPRTLNMSMHSIRDLSIIATPPAKRLAVKTFVRQKDDSITKEAILREIKRGGQVYFLHNSVETIQDCMEELQAMVPEARIDIAHGQMRERELERIMSDFYHQRFNVLVCTTIIETGIDIPTANTILIDRADNFGLAQLHQLRGRVGRSHHQAYAYLLTPPPKRMTKDAQKRLEAIESLEDLGAGFALATHDLEIRGAGELLGDEQSGQMTSIGFSLYMDMLDQAVESLKQGKEISLENALKKQTEVELRLPALLPDIYIPDVNTRLSVYKRIASAVDTDALNEIQVELIDRFGLLPDAAKNLFKLSELKQKATTLGIRKIEAGPKGGFVDFDQQTRVDPMFIISLVQAQPRIYKMDGPAKLKFAIEVANADERFKLVQSMLNDFQEKSIAS
ncbi:transcription-repair coupling factor [Algicola sagamiensis]|uniref:transcription-repair coupling factor n=1 Tax=Algicola sagamiensis TaxID=163869 RepID=UPI00036ED57E|nr:transcription-repair coupling factor [Algicola sagamiensis]